MHCILLWVLLWVLLQVPLPVGLQLPAALAVHFPDIWQPVDVHASIACLWCRMQQQWWCHRMGWLHVAAVTDYVSL